MKRALHLLAFLLITSALMVSFIGKVNAETFNRNRIIDDSVFDNSSSMNAGSINNFLNQFPNSCISPNSGFQARVPSGYSPSGGYTYGGFGSAGDVIATAASVYGINPQVLLVTLQKEQSLVAGGAGYCNDGNEHKYAAAVGYGCPDGGTVYSYSGISLYMRNGVEHTSTGSTCVNSASKAGFSQQVIRAAWLLKFGEQRSKGNVGWAVIGGSWNNSDDPQTCYGGPMTEGTFKRCSSGSAAFYDGYTTIDGVATHMDSGATAALYWYTPHVHGNQNFYDLFTGWFGPTSNSSLIYSVIKGPSSSALYLQTSAGKYYLPSYEIMQDWGLDTLPVQQVSQTYIDNLPTHGWVNHLLSDDWGNLFIVENKKLHYVRQSDYLSLVNLTAGDAVQSLGISRSLTSDTWLGRFARDAAQPNGQIWLLDKGQKHAVVDQSMLYQWRFTSDQLTTLSSSYLNSFTTAGNVTAYANAGSTKYVVDSGRKLQFTSGGVQDAYLGSSSSVAYDASTMSLLPSNVATKFAINSATGQWFLLEGGKKHYISSSNLADIWGKTSSTPLSGLSSNFMAGLTDGGNLSYVVQTASPSAYWVVDGTKHYIPNSSIAEAWLASGASPPLYSDESLNMISRGADATTTVNASGSPYTYTMDEGTKHYLMSTQAKSSWGGSVMSVSSQLVNSIPERFFLNYLFKDSGGQGYLMMNNIKHPIDSQFYADWGINSSTPIVSATTLSRYTTSSSALKSFVKIGSSSYVMSAGNKIPLGKFTTAYNPESHDQATLPSDYYPDSSGASYLAQSTDGNDSRIWLIVDGKKLLLTFPQAVSFGYLSRGVQPTKLSPATLTSLANDSRSGSLLIQKSGSGIKFLNFGQSLGFPNGDTLTNTIGAANQILLVDDATFDSFALSGSISKIVKDDAGKLYLLDSGQRRWVTNWTAMQPYVSIPVTYLFGTTMTLIPEGAPIN